MDASCFTCELVTNVIQQRLTLRDYGHRDPARQFVHVDVIDDGHTGLPHWREANGDAESGRGSSWSTRSRTLGLQREPAGTCVWFEIAS